MEKMHGSAQKPSQWGAVAGTGWAFLAFFLPQFVLIPFEAFLQALPADTNTKLFVAQGTVELSAVALLWLILRYVYHARLRDIGLRRIVGKEIGFAVLMFPAYLIVSSVVTTLAGALFSINLQQTQDVGYSSSGTSGAGLVAIFLGLVCLAPVVEELLFRGFLFQAFRRTFGFWGGSLAVSLLFAVAHGQLNVGIDVFVLSMFLCYLREKTDNLWPSITLHALKNLLAFIVLFIIGK